MLLRIYSPNHFDVEFEGKDLVSTLEYIIETSNEQSDTFSGLFRDINLNNNSPENATSNEQYVSQLFQNFKASIDELSCEFSFHPNIVLGSTLEVDLFTKYIHRLEYPEIISIIDYSNNKETKYLLDADGELFLSDYVSRLIDVTNDICLSEPISSLISKIDEESLLEGLNLKDKVAATIQDNALKILEPVLNVYGVNYLSTKVKTEVDYRYSVVCHEFNSNETRPNSCEIDAVNSVNEALQVINDFRAAQPEAKENFTPYINYVNPLDYNYFLSGLRQDSIEEDLNSPGAIVFMSKGIGTSGNDVAAHRGGSATSKTDYNPATSPVKVFVIKNKEANFMPAYNNEK